MNTHTDFTRLMQGVIPYFAVNGAEKAVAFYERAFGAVVRGSLSKGEDGRVMNATVEINGGVIMLMDHYPEMSTEAVKGVTMTLVIEDGDMWWDRAVAAGCEVTSPLKPEFWGDRYGRMRDPFGIEWAFDEPGEENRERAARGEM